MEGSEQGGDVGRESCSSPGVVGQTIAWTGSWVEYGLRKGHILWMLYRKNLNDWVTAKIFSERDSLLSITRFLAWGAGITRVSHREIEKSGRGEVSAGMKTISVLPGLSFRWWLSIQL